MRKLIASTKSLNMVVPILLVTAYPSCIVLAQQNQQPPFGDKHVGGDVPVDERRDEAIRRGKSSFTPQPEDRVLKDGVLAPSKEDRKALASFLRTPDTGLIRLLPAENAASLAKKSLISIPGGGSHYSFANFTHSLGYGSDIRLSSGQLSVGFAGLGYGFLTNLGDVPLEEVSLSDPRTTFVATYRPAVTFLEARAETLRFRDGVTVDGIRYQEGLPAEVNATYLLRSINYGKRVFSPVAQGDTAGSARNTDVLVAFRVIRKDANGGVTIAWKLLKRYSDPKIG